MTNPVRPLAVILGCLWLYAVPSEAASMLDRVVASGRLDVCVWPDYYGVTYRNPKDGKLSGIDIELSRAFGSDLGVSVAYVDSSFARFIDDLLAERCHVAMFGVGMLPERAARVNFSLPYLASDIYAIVIKHEDRIQTWADLDQPGNVIAVQGGTFMEPVMRERLTAAELMVVRPPDTREGEIQSGRADAFMTDFPYSRRLLDNADWARLISPDRPFFRLSYAYAVKPGDEEWLNRLNRFVTDIKADGRLLAAARNNSLEPIVILD